MKKTILISLLVVVCATFSIAQKKEAPVRKSSGEAELRQVLHNLYLAYNTKDIKLFLSLMSEDGLFCGTDSKDLWDKSTYSKLMTELFADPSFHSLISVDKRKIHFDTNKNSAIVVDQFFFEWNKKIPVRHVAHFVKVGNNWMCNFISTSYIPNNEDMEKIVKALN